MPLAFWSEANCYARVLQEYRDRNKHSNHNNINTNGNTTNKIWVFDFGGPPEEASSNICDC